INGILKRLGVFPRLMPPKFSGLMTNVEQRMNMYHFVSQVLVHEIPGELVEVGCNSGESSVLITKILGEFDPSKKLHVYDSFEGLPDRAPQDGVEHAERYGAGQLKTTKDLLAENFRRYNLPLPEIHQGWFDQTLPTQLPETICFAYLDGDLYTS